jgi:hypothetical protein
VCRPQCARVSPDGVTDSVDCSPCVVAVLQGMLRLLTDKKLNGAVMRVTAANGIDFETYRLDASLRPSGPPAARSKL